MISAGEVRDVGRCVFALSLIKYFNTQQKEFTDITKAIISTKDLPRYRPHKRKIASKAHTIAESLRVFKPKGAIQLDLLAMYILEQTLAPNERANKPLATPLVELWEKISPIVDKITSLYGEEVYSSDVLSATWELSIQILEQTK